MYKYLECQGDSITDLREDFYKAYQVLTEVRKAQSEQIQKKSTKNNSKKYTASKTEHYITADTIQHKTINNINIYAAEQEKPDDISTIIYQFYEHISRGSHDAYESAWLLLSESFRDRIWEKLARETGIGKRGLDHFKDGYHFFRALKKTHVFNIEITASTADCMVYYEETLELPHIEELADITKTSIKNARLLVEKVEAFAKVVEEFGGKGFGNKALMRLFYPTPTETFWFEHGMDHVAFKDAYPSTTHTNISRLLKCRCVKHNDTWFIDGLVPLHCRQI